MSTSKATMQTLRQWRDQRGLSQAELADKAGVTSVTVSNVERGAVVPSLRVAQALARALRVSTDAVAWPDEKTVTPPEYRKDRYDKQKLMDAVRSTFDPDSEALRNQPTRPASLNDPDEVIVYMSPGPGTRDLILVARQAGKTLRSHKYEARIFHDAFADWLDKVSSDAVAYGCDPAAWERIPLPEWA